MFEVTQNAVMTLEAAKRQQQIPPQYGIRISGAPTPAGELQVRIGFAEAPLADDTVAEQHGTQVFLAPEVAGPLSAAALDVAPTASSDGDAPVELVLRPQDSTGEQ